MKTVQILLAATICTSLTMMAAQIPFGEQQHKAKFGRYTPAFEAQLKMAPATSAAVEAPECCKNKAISGATAVRGNSVMTEERSRAKYGRYTPAREQADKVLNAEIATHELKCQTLNHCPQPARTANENEPNPGNVRIIAKYFQIVTEQPRQETVVETAHAEPCRHSCCQ